MALQRLFSSAGDLTRRWRKLAVPRRRNTQGPLDLCVCAIEGEEVSLVEEKAAKDGANDGRHAREAKLGWRAVAAVQVESAAVEEARTWRGRCSEGSQVRSTAPCRLLKEAEEALLRTDATGGLSLVIV